MGGRGGVYGVRILVHHRIGKPAESPGLSPRAFKLARRVVKLQGLVIPAKYELLMGRVAGRVNERGVIHDLRCLRSC